MHGEDPELRPFTPEPPGDGDFDFFALTACPVITKSLLLTDLRPLYPKTGVFLATVVGAWYRRPSGIFVTGGKDQEEEKEEARARTKREAWREAC